METWEKREVLETIQDHTFGCSRSHASQTFWFPYHVLLEYTRQV